MPDGRHTVTHLHSKIIEVNSRIPKSTLHVKKLDFVIAGASKGGSTSVWMLLFQQDGIWMHPRKELNVFGSPDQELRLEGYLQDAPEGVLLGESSPWYMSSEKALRGMAEHNPALKLIVVLRDPIERAWSQFVFDKTLGTRPLEQTLNQAYLDRSNEHLHHMLFDHGYYDRWLRTIFEIFPREQVLVTSLPLLKEDFDSERDKLGGFLGLDLGTHKSLPRENTTGYPSGRIRIFARRCYVQARVIALKLLGERLRRNYVPDNSISGRVRTKIKGFFFSQDKPAMTEQERRFLAELYDGVPERTNALLGVKVL